MANETALFIQSGDDMFYRFDGAGGLEGVNRFNVGYSYNTSRTLRGALRFTNLQISQGQTGINADILMYAQEKIGDKDISVLVRGIDEDNTSNFSGGAPFGRTMTTASNTHTGNVSTGSYLSIGVGSIIEEIVGRGGWSSGNAIGFILEDNGTSTSSSGGYLYDNYNDSPNSFLSYRIGSEPNFKPTPVTVTAPTFPPVNSYGVKISYPGYSVIDADDAHTYFTTRKISPKTILSGKINTTAGAVYSIPHGLSYKPFARAYFKSTSSAKRFKIPRFLPGIQQDPDSDTTTGQIEVDGTNIKITTSDACEVYYYVYIDQLST